MRGTDDQEGHRLLAAPKPVSSGVAEGNPVRAVLQDAFKHHTR